MNLARGVRDRTSEFRSICDSFAKTSIGGGAVLKAENRPPQSNDGTLLSALDFLKTSAVLLNRNLGELQSLSSDCSVFDDKSLEVNNLSGLIAEALRKRSSELQSIQSTALFHAQRKQEIEHTKAMLSDLSLRFVTISKRFEQILKLHAKKVKMFQTRAITHYAGEPANAMPEEQPSLRRRVNASSRFSFSAPPAESNAETLKVQQQLTKFHRQDAR